jgi:histidyl-tRNA synthetase
VGKSMKAQMKAAGRQQARWALLLGESELTAGTIQLRDMQSGEQQEIAMNQVVDRLDADLN